MQMGSLTILHEGVHYVQSAWSPNKQKAWWKQQGGKSWASVVKGDKLAENMAWSAEYCYRGGSLGGRALVKGGCSNLKAWIAAGNQKVPGS